MNPLIACRDCAAIWRLPPLPEKGRLECWNCARILERSTGCDLDGPLACSLTTFLLLFPANCLSLMTVHIGSILQSTHLFSGVVISWQQGLQFAAVVLAVCGIILPFIRFGLLSITLTAIRWGVREAWVGTAFRYTEQLDLWAMSDVLLVGAGIGYGRVASQTQVDIDAGGWCVVGAALMTMITRASLDRQAVWRCLETPARNAGAEAVACTSCDLVLPAELEGQCCPRCTARIHRRRPHAVQQCAALTAAAVVLAPVAYVYPMSQFWKAGTPMTSNIMDGIKMLFGHGYWYFGVMILLVSVILPLTKLLGLTWFLLSIRFGWSQHLRFKTGFYRFIDEVGRWSLLDPFTVMTFTPMITLGQLAHFNAMIGTDAFLAMVVLSMFASHTLDPRLMWDVALVRAGRSKRALARPT
ncbi:MAG: paraquat-inducible protein A [Acetobacteraceae bacterium]|nr:paraquat-inducible protein A [Acetobacteraceae bacterium]